MEQADVKLSTSIQNTLIILSLYFFNSLYAVRFHRRFSKTADNDFYRNTNAEILSPFSSPFSQGSLTVDAPLIIYEANVATFIFVVLSLLLTVKVAL